jgi:hypothetical protein
LRRRGIAFRMNVRLKHLDAPGLATVLDLTLRR